VGYPHPSYLTGILFDGNRLIELSVAPTVSQPSSTESVTDSEGNSNTITLLSERRLESGQILLRDSQTLVLSGIIQDSDRVSVTKIPILGDIPLLGALFRSTNKENQRQEVIVLLTPQIIDNSDRASFGYDYIPGPDIGKLLYRNNQRSTNP
jgi:type IV pilus assembly protein PilQ